MNYIGIFDSGVGGLGIFSEIRKLLPKENILYFADTANCPYGEKSIAKIKEICWKNTEFLIDQGAKIIVVACNSASVSALNYLRSEFPDVPIIGVVPVVKTAAKITKNNRIGILATEATVDSDYLKGLVNEFCAGKKIYYQKAGELVDLVENIYYKKQPEIEKKVRNSIRPLISNGVDVIALGCTHFPFLKKEIEKLTGPKITVLNSNGAVARQVKRVLYKNKDFIENETPKYVFYTTGLKGILIIQLRRLINFNAKKIHHLKWKK